ncbi:hypothetical protein IPF86_03315 [Candidatus Nomurabacteria bacterium]|nr:MAG: hypothetical protein IPF86_03315 [Candidatus Nomurabacteria bacterium]
MNRSHLIALGIIALVGIALIVSIKNETINKPDATHISESQEYVTYKISEYGLEFIFPKSWGSISLNEGNKNCPEEDTYRTADTLNVFDFEYVFPDVQLENSESFIRSGIRMYELEPQNKNDCGDDFLLKIATGEVAPEILSSFRLFSITTPSGLSGIHNPEASRLNTESRTQYTFFIPKNQSTGLTVLQAYMSFIPYFDSPELEELENNFSGDMEQYINKGITAVPVRAFGDDLKKMVESLTISGK